MTLTGPATAAGTPTTDSRAWIGEDKGRRALLVDGVVQSVALDTARAREGYWTALLPDVRPRRALLLGYGGGTLAHLLVERFGPLEIVGVDDDPRVVELATALFGAPPPAEIVALDAFEFVATTERRFDFVAVDLFHAGTVPRGLFGRPFLRRLKGILAPSGSLAVNLFWDRQTQDRLARLTRVFTLTGQRRVGSNLVVHLR